MLLCMHAVMFTYVITYVRMYVRVCVYIYIKDVGVSAHSSL